MMNQRFKIALFVLLLFLSGISHAAFEEATEALQAKDFTAALQSLDGVPEAERDNPQWQLLQAAAEAGGGKMAQAEERYLSLIERAPTQPEAYNNLAALYASQGKLDEAIELLERAMKTSESYATVYANLRSIYYEMSRSSYARALQMEQRKVGPALSPILLVAEAPQAEPVKTEPPLVVAVAEPTSVEPVALEQPVEAEAEPAQPPEAVNVALVAVEGVATPPLPAPEVEVPQPDEVITMLNRWAADWMGQKVEAYLAAYAAEFQPGKGLSLEQWRAQRRKRLSRPDSIEVHLADFEVQFSAEDRASVTVVQFYRSERYTDTVRKRFQLKHDASGWKIMTEKTIEVL